jgi:hypothetical protein
MFRLNARTLRANVDVFSLENVRSPALMWISEPGVAPLSRAYPRLMNAVPSGLSRRFATKLNGHSFSTPSRPKEEPKNCQEPFPLFCDVFPVYLSIKTRKIQYKTVLAVVVQPRWGKRGEWVPDYPGCAARPRPWAMESNAVSVLWAMQFKPFAYWLLSHPTPLMDELLLTLTTVDVYGPRSIVDRTIGRPILRLIRTN